MSFRWIRNSVASQLKKERKEKGKKKRVSLKVQPAKNAHAPYKEKKNPTCLV